MTENQTDKLSKIINNLPQPETTIYSYEPISFNGTTAFLAGQIPKRNGTLSYVGKVGDEISLTQAKQAAIICTEQGLAWFNARAGGLNNLKSILRITFYIAHSDDFYNISDVADSASNYLIEVLGCWAKHPRSVIGVKSLPCNAPILIEITAQLHKAIE